MSLFGWLGSNTGLAKSHGPRTLEGENSDEEEDDAVQTY